MLNDENKANNLLIEFTKACPIAQERILETAKILLKNRHFPSLGKDKEYMHVSTYISTKEEGWDIRHIIQDTPTEKKEVIHISGWVRYEDLGVTANITDYDGTKQSSISVTGIEAITSHQEKKNFFENITMENH